MIGRTLNNIYRVSELVGGGGFADVYLGRDLRTNTVVAIKILHQHYARDPQIVQRFLQEARTAQGLVEPHIVRVLDAGEDNGTYYIVMEYVQGHTLAHLIQTRGALPIQEAVEYTRQILMALDAAHRAGIVHRDIKPQNVMVTPDGTVKVMDFGIAKHAAAGKMTQTGMYLGTPQYMSPEQARGERVHARSDLYSVAIVLYELLGGRPPFDAESPWQVLRMQTDVEAPPVSQLRADVPPGLAQVIGRGLEKAPERRLQSAGEMLEALSGPGQAAQPVGVRGRMTSPQQGAGQDAEKRRQVGQSRPESWRQRALALALPAGLAGLVLVVLVPALRPPAPPLAGQPTPAAASSTVQAPVSPVSPTRVQTSSTDSASSGAAEQPSETIAPSTQRAVVTASVGEPTSAAGIPPVAAAQPLPAAFWSVCVWCDYGTFDPKEEAEAMASRVRAAGLHAIVLYSSDFQSLRPGYWVTFSGVFDAEQQAKEHQTKLAGVGLDGQVRWVSRAPSPTTTEQAFWTVVVASLDKRTDAEAVAGRLRSLGLPGDVLQSSDHTSLNPGYSVVYSGRFADSTTASLEAARLRELGFSAVYPREVRR